MIRLIRPSIKYKRSYLEALKEFHNEGRNQDQNYEKISSDFSGFLKNFQDQVNGKNLSKGMVPESNFWLVDIERKKFLGRISIRHKLNGKLRKLGGHIGYQIRSTQRKKGYGKRQLELALPKAKELGIKKALVTCDEDNIGSKKIIEYCGGIFKSKTSQGKNKPKLLKYCIEVL